MVQYVKKIIRLEEFEASWDKNNLSAKFTGEELNTYSREMHKRSLSARYAAKLCLAEIAGEPVPFNEIEILNDEMGKPVLTMSENIKKTLSKKNITTIELSLSHSKIRSAALIVFTNGDN
jgi:holo-[acyl-carrier protein] synthase